jgi:hypothetical protein
MEIKAKINDPINPIERSNNSFELKLNFVSNISSTVAPRMVGTAKINENSAAVFLLIPRRSAPKMLDPARETPGIIEML